jgi:hypothetical protein
MNNFFLWYPWYSGCGIRLENFKYKSFRAIKEVQRVESKLLRVGDYFVNLNTLLWAQIRSDGRDKTKRLLLLVYGHGENSRQMLQVDSVEAEQLIAFLESNSIDLRK